MKIFEIKISEPVFQDTFGPRAPAISFRSTAITSYSRSANCYLVPETVLLRLTVFQMHKLLII